MRSEGGGGPGGAPKVPFKNLVGKHTWSFINPKLINHFQAIKVYVRTPKDKKKILTNETASVADFKAIVSVAFSIPVGQLCLTFGHKILKDEDTLRSCGITDDDMVHLVRVRDLVCNYTYCYARILYTSALSLTVAVLR